MELLPLLILFLTSCLMCHDCVSFLKLCLPSNMNNISTLHSKVLVSVVFKNLWRTTTKARVGTYQPSNLWIDKISLSRMTILTAYFHLTLPHIKSIVWLKSFTFHTYTRLVHKLLPPSGSSIYSTCLDDGSRPLASS